MAAAVNTNEEKVRINNLRDKCDALYAWHKEPVYRIALKALNDDRAAALDVTERAFLVAFRHIGDIEEVQSDKAKAFMVATVKGVLNVLYQKARERAGIPSEFNKIYITEQDRFDVDQVLIRNELVADLARYVDKLTYRERELIFYHYFVGWTLAQVGKQVQLSEGDVESCMFQIKQKLAKMIVGEKRTF